MAHAQLMEAVGQAGSASSDPLSRNLLVEAPPFITRCFDARIRAQIVDLWPGPARRRSGNWLIARWATLVCRRVVDRLQHCDQHFPVMSARAKARFSFPEALVRFTQQIGRAGLEQACDLRNSFDSFWERHGYEDRLGGLVGEDAYRLVRESVRRSVERGNLPMPAGDLAPPGSGRPAAADLYLRYLRACLGEGWKHRATKSEFLSLDSMIAQGIELSAKDGDDHTASEIAADVLLSYVDEAARDRIKAMFRHASIKAAASELGASANALYLLRKRLKCDFGLERALRRRRQDEGLVPDIKTPRSLHGSACRLFLHRVRKFGLARFLENVWDEVWNDTTGHYAMPCGNDCQAVIDSEFGAHDGLRGRIDQLHVISKARGDFAPPGAAHRGAAWHALSRLSIGDGRLIAPWIVGHSLDELCAVANGTRALQLSMLRFRLVQRAIVRRLIEPTADETVA
ncbi:MAG: hypothetical protein AAF628_34075 [Planctomycetota bacterium]